MSGLVETVEGYNLEAVMGDDGVMLSDQRAIATEDGMQSLDIDLTPRTRPEANAWSKILRLASRHLEKVAATLPAPEPDA